MITKEINDLFTDLVRAKLFLPNKDGVKEALKTLIDTPRSCTANFLIGHQSQGAIDIDLAPETMNIIN